MQKALYYFLANNLASEEDKKKLTETFKALDANGDGVLSKEEIRQGYKKTCGITNEELEVLIKEVDSNSNASINYSEFMVAALNRRELLTDAKIEACFRLFDRVSSAKVVADLLGSLRIYFDRRVPRDAWRIECKPAKVG